MKIDIFSIWIGVIIMEIIIQLMHKRRDRNWIGSMGFMLVMGCFLFLLQKFSE